MPPFAADQPDPPAIELFRDGDLRAFRMGSFASDACVVTFDSYTDKRTLDRTGFGQKFFLTRNIDAIHVLSRDNEWWQHDGLTAALETVRAAVGSYRRVVAYGSSMGAYAALRFGEWAGAGCAVALSPQYSIDPAVAGFEKRWPEASARFRAVWEGRTPFATPGEAYVAFDPRDRDRMHVARLARECAFTPIALPGAGHPVTGFLMDLGLLQRLLLMACRGESIDVPGLVAEALQRREESAQYLIVQAKQTHRVARRIALLEKAVRTDTLHAAALSHLGTALGDVGRYAEALARHREGLALEPGHPHLLLQYSYTLQQSGDIAGALAVMTEAAPVAGDPPSFGRRIARLQELSEGRAGWRGLLRRFR